jgi:hypothetical protein
MFLRTERRMEGIGLPPTAGTLFLELSLSQHTTYNRLKGRLNYCFSNCAYERSKTTAHGITTENASCFHSPTSWRANSLEILQ